MIIIKIPKTSNIKQNEFIDWLYQNLGRYSYKWWWANIYVDSSLGFAYEEDAIMFKLRFKV